MVASRRTELHCIEASPEARNPQISVAVHCQCRPCVGSRPKLVSIRIVFDRQSAPCQDDIVAVIQRECGRSGGWIIRVIITSGPKLAALWRVFDGHISEVGVGILRKASYIDIS